MELAEVSRLITEEARQLQAEIESLRLVFDIYGPTESIESTLSRIEERLIDVHGHTGKLIERVPQSLASILAELKETILLRIDSLKPTATESNRSTESNESKRPDKREDNWLGEVINDLTPQEKRLFQVCFESGLITYKELASRLDVTPISAKNTVNRLFQSEKKRALFRKECTHGIAKVGLDEEIQRRILKGDQQHPSARKMRQVQRPARR